MTSGYIPFSALMIVASVLAGTAVLEFAAPAVVGRAPDRPPYPRGLMRSAGSIQLAAALFLVLPPTRIWGIAAAAGIGLVGLIVLFNNGRFLWCLPAFFLLAMLVPAAFAL